MKPAAPQVSIITAAYKSDPGHLRAAVKSAIQQSWHEIDIIVSDDSPDSRLGEVIESLQDQRVRYRHNQPALGVAENHWKCLREATGEFVVILNQDDTLQPTFVERLLAPLRADAALALAFCDHWIIDTGGKQRVFETEATSQRYGRTGLTAGAHRPFLHLLTRQTIPMAMGAMLRRALLPDSFPPDAGPAYDLWLTYLLCRTRLGAWYVPERLSSWRAHSANLTSVSDIGLLSGAARCWAAVACDPNTQAIRRSAIKRESQAYCACSRWYSQHHRREQSRNYAWRSLAARANWRALGLYAMGMLPMTLARRLG